MRRRTLIKRTAALATAGTLAGCVGQYNPADETTADPATTEPQPPSLTDSDLSVIDSGCGTETNEATVSFDDGTRLVTVTGTITGSDACKTATLADAAYDADADELAVTVATTDKEDAEMCGQCLTEIEYEAEFSFDGGLPASVTVSHQSMGETSTVATTDR